jgi:hypothetical protein
MIGRHVKDSWSGIVGVVTEWQPLGAAMCDVLVNRTQPDHYGRTGLVWCASYSLTPTDGQGPLPSRREAQETARVVRVAALEAIRAQHVAACRPGGEKWPGCEFAKALVGKAIDGALADAKAGVR